MHHFIPDLKLVKQFRVLIGKITNITITSVLVGQCTCLLKLFNSRNTEVFKAYKKIGIKTFPRVE